MPLVYQTLLYGLSDLVYPPHCLGCQKYLNTRFPQDPLCALCATRIQFNRPPFCPCCFRPVGVNNGAPVCSVCVKFKVHFDQSWSACLYADLLQDLIHKFKYEQRTYLRHYFTKIMLSFIEASRLDFRGYDFLMPIPLSSTRLRERGYNQAQLIAQLLAQTLNKEISTHDLMRVRHTPSQTLLKQKERWTNLHGAFRIKNPEKISERSILLVDDLLTTGATASEAAFVLKNSGAKRVGILTLAVTP